MLNTPVFQGVRGHGYHLSDPNDQYGNSQKLNLHIQSKYGKLRARKTFIFGHFLRNLLAKYFLV